MQKAYVGYGSPLFHLSLIAGLVYPVGGTSAQLTVGNLQPIETLLQHVLLQVFQYELVARRLVSFVLCLRRFGEGSRGRFQL